MREKKSVKFDKHPGIRVKGEKDGTSGRNRSFTGE